MTWNRSLCAAFVPLLIICVFFDGRMMELVLQEQTLRKTHEKLVMLALEFIIVSERALLSLLRKPRKCDTI
jgi:hypothetical protein